MQTSWIAASLFIGFIVYVTVKGQLAAYQQAIFGGQNQIPTNQYGGTAGNVAAPSGTGVGTGGGSGTAF
jgi:hypothetical protein